MGKRRFSREIILKVLFQMDVGRLDIQSALKSAFDGISEDKCDGDFVKRIVNGVNENLEHIDSIIKERLKNWKMERLCRVDKNILRMAIYEMLFCTDVPQTVSINEAIEIAKIYGTEDSGKFVNGILGGLVREK